MFGDGVSDGWVFFLGRVAMEFQSLQRGGGQMMSFRVPPCHCYHDVHQQMTIISVTTKFMDGANLTPSWCHDFIIRLVFKKKTVLTCW